MAKIYAYARCSLGEEYGQDLRRQTRELEAAGAEEIITEREHGDKEKACLNDLLECMEPQSTLMVCEVSVLPEARKCCVRSFISSRKSICGWSFLAASPWTAEMVIWIVCPWRFCRWSVCFQK